MKYASGQLLTSEGFIEGYIGFQQQRGLEFGKGSPPEKPFVKGIIIPPVVNGHTHIGDSFVRSKHLDLPRKVQDLVAAPNGLKHRLLRDASEEEILKGMRASLQTMTAIGTSHFCDFREAGIKGILQLRTAMKTSSIRSLILSRPSQMTYSKEEMDRLLTHSDGIGLSSISDWESSEIEKIAGHVNRKKKLFAIHASEVIREDIDRILDLNPSFLVHMVSASESDLLRVKEANIPIVLCPRAYAFFQIKTNIKLMKHHHLTLFLGTDNAMINTPNIIEEVQFLQQTTHVFTPEELLTMVTYTPRKALNLVDRIQGLNLLSNFIVLDTKTLQTLYIGI